MILNNARKSQALILLVFLLLPGVFSLIQLPPVGAVTSSRLRLMPISGVAAQSSPQAYPCKVQNTVDVWYWTPVILLNSPYGGSSSASSGVSYTGQYTFGGFSSSTTSYNGLTISASNGGATGMFELDDWRYETFTTGSPCPPQEVFINYASGNFQGKDLLSPGSRYESNELTSFSMVFNGVTYSSITFQNAYSTNNDGSIGTCQLTSGTSQNIVTSSTTSISVSVDFSPVSYVATGLLDISVSSTSSSSFTYNYPGLYATWYRDSLNGQTGTAQGALGFLFQNCPPSTPSGPTTLGVLYPGTYSTTLTDPGGLSLQYQFSWGDGSYTTTGWYASGAQASASHAWAYHGAYYVSVRAYDGTSWSEWSPSLTVTVTGGRCCVPP